MSKLLNLASLSVFGSDLLPILLDAALKKEQYLSLQGRRPLPGGSSEGIGSLFGFS